MINRWVKGEGVCKTERKVQLGFEKLVSLFSVLAAGYLLSCASCAAELVLGQSGKDERKRAGKAVTVTAGLHASIDAAMRGMGDDGKRIALAQQLEAVLRNTGSTEEVKKKAAYGWKL